MLRWDIYRRPFGGSAAGHARSYGAEDPGVHGPAARLCHRAPHRAGFRRPSAFEPGYALSCAAAPATAGLDYGPLGHVGEQPPRPLLRDHPLRPQATGGRGGGLGTHGGDHQPPAADATRRLSAEVAHAADSDLAIAPAGHVPAWPPGPGTAG